MLEITIGCRVQARVQLRDDAGDFDMPKVSADDITLGAAVYGRASDGLVTTTSSGNPKVGVAVSAAGNGTASVRVRLNGSF